MDLSGLALFPSGYLFTSPNHYIICHNSAWLSVFAQEDWNKLGKGHIAGKD